MYKRGIELVSTKNNIGFDRKARNQYIIQKVADNADRASIIVPGVLAVQCTAGSDASVDGAVTADTTTTIARKAMGIVQTVADDVGTPNPRNQRLTTESGICSLLPLTGSVFRCVEDGVGGYISDANSYGYASLVIGTPTSTSDANTFAPNPEPNYLIDSSTVSGGTASNRMIHLLGPDPSIQNLNGPRAFLFEFVSTWVSEIG